MGGTVGDRATDRWSYCAAIHPKQCRTSAGHGS